MEFMISLLLPFILLFVFVLALCLLVLCIARACVLIWSTDSDNAGVTSKVKALLAMFADPLPKSISLLHILAVSLIVTLVVTALISK